MSSLVRTFASGSSFAWASMLLQTLAWPAAAVAIAAILRAEIRLAVERLTRLKYRDFEAQFRVELARVESLDDDGPPAKPPSPTRLLDLPTISRRVFPEMDALDIPSTSKPRRRGPRSLIESAWGELSAAAERVTGIVGADPAPALASRGLLSPCGLVALERLRGLRASLPAAIGWEPSEDIAARFAVAARKLASRIGKGPSAGC